MLDQVDQNLKELKENFSQRVTFSAIFRKAQLNQLLKGVEKLKKDMEEAVFQDLGRCHYFTEFAEITTLIEFINHHVDNLDDYM